MIPLLLTFYNLCVGSCGFMFKHSHSQTHGLLQHHSLLSFIPISQNILTGILVVVVPGSQLHQRQTL